MATTQETELKIDQSGIQPTKKEQSTLNQPEANLILKKFHIEGLLKQVRIKYWSGKGEIKEIFGENNNGIQPIIGYKLVAEVPTVMLHLKHKDAENHGRWDGKYSEQRENHSIYTKVSDCIPVMGNIKTELSIQVTKNSDAKFNLIVKDGPRTKDPGLVRPEPDRKCPDSVSLDFPLFEYNGTDNSNQTSIPLNNQMSAPKELKETLIKYFNSRSKTNNLPLQMKKMAEAFFVKSYHKEVPIELKDLTKEFTEWTKLR
jgi:hypothetical protein